MTTWVDVGALADLKFAPGAPVKVGEHWVALFRDGGDLFAIDNACPHASAPLCDGTQFGGKVACWMHHWEFDLRSGACDVGKDWGVRTWPVRVVDGRVQIQVDASTPRA
ncbi:MAG: Rieske 2Fe-2S domain-containing protein [Planctomycetes bacterium]|nr:Rieske 2Fe-2S domain-containing protein [Planctomycetota bacterium]